MRTRLQKQTFKLSIRNLTAHMRMENTQIGLRKPDKDFKTQKI